MKFLKLILLFIPLIWASSFVAISSESRNTSVSLNFIGIENKNEESKQAINLNSESKRVVLTNAHKSQKFFIRISTQSIVPGRIEERLFPDQFFLPFISSPVFCTRCKIIDSHFGLLLNSYIFKLLYPQHNFW